MQTEESTTTTQDRDCPVPGSVLRAWSRELRSQLDTLDVLQDSITLLINAVEDMEAAPEERQGYFAYQGAYSANLSVLERVKREISELSDQIDRYDCPNPTPAKLEYRERWNRCHIDP